MTTVATPDTGRVAARAVTGHKRARRGRRRAFSNALAVVFILVWILPIYWMINTAFKPRQDILSDTPQFIPVHPTLHNFTEAVTKGDFLLNLRNSVIVVLASIVVSLGFALFAAAALSRFRFRGRRAIMVMLLIVQMVPITALLIPMFLIFNKLNLLGTYLGLILSYVAIVLPLTIWVMRGFYVAIPSNLDEAARMDGASNWQVLTKILFPLVAPGVIATGVFAFITAWNDYLLAYTFMKAQTTYTLPVWLASFTSQTTGTAFGPQMAGSVLFCIPVVVFFLCIQRRLVTGLSAGAVKG